MRVAIRRLRTALVLFDRTLSPIRRNGSRPSSSASVGCWARPVTGTCSALDTLPKALGDAPGASWEHLLREAAEPQRRVAHQRVEEEIGRPALTGFVLGMMAWAEDGNVRPAAGRQAHANAPREASPRSCC